jgi:hypothetical protein
MVLLDLFIVKKVKKLERLRRKLEVGSRKLEVGRPKLEVGRPKSGVGRKFPVAVTIGSFPT